METIRYSMYAVLTVVLMSCTQSDRSDYRWVRVPSVDNEVFDGHSSTSVWAFQTPNRQSEIEIIVILDQYDSHTGKTLAHLIVNFVTTPVPLDVEDGFSDRVKATYETGILTFDFLKWAHSDGGEIFVQIDMTSTPLTAGTYFTVLDYPTWKSQAPEFMYIPLYSKKRIIFERNMDSKSPPLTNITIELKTELTLLYDNTTNYTEDKPVYTITIFPGPNNGTVVIHQEYLDPSLSEKFHIWVDPLMVDVRLQILNMSQSLAGRYDVTFHFNICGLRLHQHVHVILEAAPQLITGTPSSASCPKPIPFFLVLVNSLAQYRGQNYLT